MNWHDLATALCLMLVLESVLPAAAPRQWQRALANLTSANPGHLRWFGIGGLLVGAILLQWLRGE